MHYNPSLFRCILPYNVFHSKIFLDYTEIFPKYQFMLTLKAILKKLTEKKGLNTKKGNYPPI